MADPRALYEQIAELLQPAQLAQAQKKIRTTLRREREIGADAAVITACVLHATGFPAHRILRYLSLYVPATIPPSLFQLAADVIFRGAQPISDSLLYDLTRYTYLERRLLARKGAEISEALGPVLDPGMLLYLYLLALRDDLTNEHVHLIALVLKECAPSLVLKTRATGVTTEESDEIVRALKAVESSTLEGPRQKSRAGTRSEPRPFDRQSASAFLDRYFSDEALARMRASAPPPVVRKAPSPPPATVLESEPPSAPRLARKPSAAPARESASPSAMTSGSAPAAPTPAASPRRPVRPAAAPTVSPARHRAPSAPPRRTARSFAEPRRRTATERVRAAAVGTPPTARSREGRRWPHRLVLFIWPTIVAAVAVAAVVLTRPGGPAPRPAQTAAAVVQPAAPEPAAAAAAPPPPTITYTVKPGDSLWKIFSSMRTDRRQWGGFLSDAQSMNGLADPNRLRPGRVLTINAGE